MIKYTDQEFTYQQTPVSYDGIAKLDSIKGNTVAWNQLEKNDASTNTSTGVTFTNNGDGSWTVTGTPTGFVSKYVSNTGFNATIGHKYLFFGRPYISDSAVSTRVSIRPTINGQTQSILRDYGDGTVIEATTIDPVRSQILISAELSSSLNLVFHPMIIDLTLLGMDEVTDKASFQRFFPLSYYPYTTGTLLDFKGTGIKTTGKNLLSYNGENLPYNSNGISITRENNIYKIVASNPSGYPFTRINTIHYLPKGQYTVTMLGAETSNTGIAWRLIDRNVSPVNILVNTSATTTTFRLNEDAHDVYFEITIDASKFTTGTWDVRFQLNMGLPSEYEPYTESVLSLPVSTYFPAGMKSAGSAYDELTDSKAITRIGEVDLGTLTWTYNNTQDHLRFVSSSISPSPTDPSGAIANAICSKYEIVNEGQVYNNTKVGLCIISQGRAMVYDPNYTDATAFTSAMSGVYLYYELATPTEQDINADLFYKFFGDGTEEILPTNGSTPTTSAFFGDIEYYTQFDSEVPYRKFWMVNSKGDRWNLTEHEVRSFMNNPQGFGFAKTISTTRYGNAQVLTDVTDNFPSPSGEVLFYDSHNSTRYEQYNEFVKFLSYEPVTLYYKLPFSFYSQIPNVYTLECVVGTLTKTESKTDNIMTCPITFNALSYYKGDEVNINGTGTSYTITNDGDFPVGFEITLEGSLTNPYITLEQDGDLYGEAKFDDSTAFDKVYVDSKDGEQNVVLEQGGSILPNPLSYQDLSISNGSIYVTFVKLARGESTLTIGMDSGSLTSANIKFAPIYRSV